jgi:hypothetical protein
MMVADCEPRAICHGLVGAEKLVAAAAGYEKRRAAYIHPE